MPGSTDPFEEIGDYCLSVGWVTWEKPRRGGYCYGRAWNRHDPQMVVKCEHRHQKPSEAMKCMRRYVRSGKARTDFGMES